MKKNQYNHIGETVYSEKMDNGLRVYLLPRQESSKTFAFFSTAFGSNDIQFQPGNNEAEITSPLGVAHFLEHKMFDKGDHDVFMDFGREGAQANAYTNNTETAYFFTATEKTNQLITLLLDFVQEPYFSDDTVEREKGIITQEAQMYLDQPDEKVYLATLESLFHKHPIKYPVIGTVESINKMTKEDLYNSYHSFYHPGNMTLCIAGKFDPEEMMTLIRDNQSAKDFSPIPEVTRYYGKEPDQVARKEAEIKMAAQTAKCMVGLKCYSNELSADELLEYSSLSDIIMTYLFSQSGQFYKLLYKEGAIDSSFFSENICESNYGFALVGGNTDNPLGLANRIKELLISTKDLQIDEQAFKKLKKRKIGSLLRQMNSIEVMAQEYVWHANRGIQYYDLIKQTQDLTAEQANAFLNNWVAEERLTYTILSNQS